MRLLIVRGVCVFLLLCQAPGLCQSKPRVVHVFVALADNKNQGIVPVAPRLGNGEDPEHNLYWGSAYRVKTFFARSPEWRATLRGREGKARCAGAMACQPFTTRVLSGGVRVPRLGA